VVAPDLKVAQPPESFLGLLRPHARGCGVPPEGKSRGKATWTKGARMQGISGGLGFGVGRGRVSLFTNLDTGHSKLLRCIGHPLIYSPAEFYRAAGGRAGGGPS
jgi:hypothetical protein